AGTRSVGLRLIGKHDRNPNRHLCFCFNIAHRGVMSVGAFALLAGGIFVVTGLSFRSAAIFFVGTAVAGMGFGTGFQGAVRSIVPFAAAHERAGVLSVIFVVSYLAMGLPAMVAGYFVLRDGSISTTAREFGMVVIVLSALALLGGRLRRRK
ncbi:MAG: hypothetical protein QM760_04645, partial [Nibricoccus sp.]